MNLQTAVPSRLDPVLGVNPPGSTPSAPSTGSSDTFAQLLDRRVNESQGTSSSPPAATAAPAPADTAQTAPAKANGTANSRQSSQDDDPATTPPSKTEAAKEEAPPPATSDETAAKKAKPTEEAGTAAEVATPADAVAAALAAAAMPAAASAGHAEAPLPADGDGKTLSAARAPAVSTSASTTNVADKSTATNGSVQPQTASTVTAATPEASLALPSTSSPTPSNDDAAAAPTASDTSVAPGSPLAMLRAVLEKLSNAPKESVQTPEAGQSGEPASTESQVEAGATLKNSPSGKHDPSPLLDAATSAAPSEKSPTDVLKPEKTGTSETPSSVRAEHADSMQSSSPSARSDGFTPTPHLSTRADSPAPTTVLTVHTPPADAERWASETTQRLVWVAGRGETKAELQLTPPSLGKLEVTLQLNNDQLTAHFVAASQAARDALEHALPQLREQLAQSGLSLGQTSVSTGGGDSNPQSQEDPAPGRTLTGTASRAGANPAPLPLQSTRAGSSLIDHYA